MRNSSGRRFAGAWISSVLVATLLSSTGCEEERDFGGDPTCGEVAAEFCGAWREVGARHSPSQPETGLVRVFRGHVSKVADVSTTGASNLQVGNVVITIDETMDVYSDITAGAELLFCGVELGENVVLEEGDEGIYAFKVDTLIPASETGCATVAPDAVFPKGATPWPLLPGDGEGSYEIPATEDLDPACATSSFPAYRSIAISWEKAKAILVDLGLEPLTEQAQWGASYKSDCYSALYHAVPDDLVLPSECAVEGTDVICTQ